MHWISDAPVIITGFLGSMATGLATGVGALPIFLRRHWDQAAQAAMLAFAAGVMLAATLFSLIVPALEVVTARTGSHWYASGIVTAAVALGTIGIWALDTIIPHEHFMKGPEGHTIFALGRNWLFILAITLHNLPEGLSVGVAYGGGPVTGLMVTLGIGMQNLPEGLAVAAALAADGFSRRRAFWVSLATGMVEPLGGLIGASAVSASNAILPWGLGFAGGAMLYVISYEIIPETHRNGLAKLATFSLIIGFLVMMYLDVGLS
jgi:zinc transporter, ZIP family